MSQDARDRSRRRYACSLDRAGSRADASAAADQGPRHAQPVAVALLSERPPLTVNKRSFLDPGPVVPVGTMQNYVTLNTIYNRTPDQVAQRSKYGNETLPWPLEIPGRAPPIYEFETPALD